MPQYEPTQQIIALSLEELKFILGWIRKRGEPASNPTTVLIGGWAVDAYNPWYGSIDIDLITNASTKRSLLHALRTARDLCAHPQPGAFFIFLLSRGRF